MSIILLVAGIAGAILYNYVRILDISNEIAVISIKLERLQSRLDELEAKLPTNDLK